MLKRVLFIISVFVFCLPFNSSALEKIYANHVYVPTEDGDPTDDGVFYNNAEFYDRSSGNYFNLHLWNKIDFYDESTGRFIDCGGHNYLYFHEDSNGEIFKTQGLEFGAFDSSTGTIIDSSWEAIQLYDASKWIIGDTVGGGTAVVVHDKAHLTIIGKDTSFSQTIVAMDHSKVDVYGGDFDIEVTDRATVNIYGYGLSGEWIDGKPWYLKVTGMLASGNVVDMVIVFRGDNHRIQIRLHEYQRAPNIGSKVKNLRQIAPSE